MLFRFDTKDIRNKCFFFNDNDDSPLGSDNGGFYDGDSEDGARERSGWRL